MDLKRSGAADDPDFGRVPTGRVLPQPRAAPTPATIDVPARSPEVSRSTTPYSCPRSSAHGS